MTHLLEVTVPSQSLDRIESVVGEPGVALLKARAEDVKKRLNGRAIWNINSTAHGGGVAEMLYALMPYVRGLGIDTRWTVIEGNPDFFRLTKRLHHALHGSKGDGSDLGPKQHETYEAVMHENFGHLSGIIEPGDVVILHDPQTAGLASHLMAHGAHVVWRCHVGTDEPGPEVDLAWDFLAPYLANVPATIFTREQYIPDCCDHGRSMIIPPSIDPFSPKNQEMDERTQRSILVHTGIIEGPNGVMPTFERQDGSPGRVDRRADIIRSGRPPAWDTPLIVQVSRWDPLKDPVGVMEGFGKLLERSLKRHPELVLAGPNVSAVSDDPEGKGTLDRTEAAWRRLPHGFRDRVHLACLPMADDEENAAIVNALQRHATIVVQKSLKEGFGLTVTEAMWKSRPVVGSGVGGIRDQIEDGKSGILLGNPQDLDEFAGALETLLNDPKLCEKMGRNAHERVHEHYLGARHLLQYAELVERVTGG